MESTKQQHHLLTKDDHSPENPRPSLRINQSLDEVRRDGEQRYDQTEHSDESASSSAQLFDELETLPTPFPVDSSNSSSFVDLKPFSPSLLLLSQQYTPLLSQPASFSTPLNDFASINPSAAFSPFTYDLHSTYDSNQYASSDSKTAPKSLPTSENEKNIVAEALIGLHTRSGEHVQGDVLGERKLNRLSTKPSCRCKSSQCLQLYCSCFRAGEHCTDLCQCKKCHNTLSPKLSPSNRHPKNCTCHICSAAVTQKLRQVRQSTSESSHGCKCKSSHGCLKLYCRCFQSGNLCNPDRCKCVGCKNTARDDSGIRHKAVESCLKRRLDAFDVRPGKGNAASCSCEKTACLRKYCVCFANNRECTSACSCIGCLNLPVDVTSQGGSVRL